MIWCIFWPFSGSEGPPEGPWGSPMVLNGQPSVPWEVEMKYSTMGLFHYGRTLRFTNKRWSKKYLMIWCIFWPFFGSEGTPKGPWGFPMVPNGQPSVPWKVEMNYSTMGLFKLWENWEFHKRKVIKEMSDFLHILAVFRLWRVPWGPLRISNGSKWTI